ncbi:NAD(P)-dependent oxidoreductase [Candidatus Woesearchaeota archaeon]|nr:NAD(P)-dependent oxidoreductase [Candidatus Woesearchaeota archaeon]
MQKKRILITGCGGMLGQAVYERFSTDYDVKATDIDVNEPWLSYLDVRDHAAVEKAMLSFKPDFVFHLAALTDLEYCEAHPDEAYKTNTLGTENVALLAKEFDIPMVYISTAGIFDGQKDQYHDYDTPNPLSHYGKSKYYAELFVRQHLTKYFVVRAGWMMGGGKKKDKKFVAKIVQQIKAGKKEIFAVTDLYGTPTYTHHFAQNLHHIIQTRYYGLYNMVSGGGATRYDVAAEILKILKLDSTIQLVPTTTDKTSTFFSQTYTAPRPRSEQLLNLRLNHRDLNTMQDWRVALREYIERDWIHEV